MNIRAETARDINAIETLTYCAFEGHPHHEEGAKPTEHLIINRLRETGALALSLVAQDETGIIGHAAFSLVNIDGANNWYGLAPVSVQPDRQGEGIGTQLIQTGLAMLKEQGAEGCVVLGEPEYYTRFGFKAHANLTLAGIPPEFFLIQSLSTDVDPIPSSAVTYHSAFNGQFNRHGELFCRSVDSNFMDNYLHEGGIQPFIIVMPFGEKSYYQGKYETHIMDEVMGYVDMHYRVKAGKASTTISGTSMGGFGAFYLAHRHQDVFGLAVPLSGYFNMSLYPELEANGKITMESQLYFYCGRDDSTSFASNEALVKKLKQNDVNFTYQITAGGHTWRYWNGISKEFLKVVSDYFNKS